MKVIKHWSYKHWEWSEKETIFLFPQQREILEKVECSDRPLKEGDKVFFTNSVDFPRFKFREWAKHKGINITHNAENATVIIVDKSMLEGLLASQVNMIKQRLESAWIKGPNYGSIKLDGIHYYIDHKPWQEGDSVSVKLTPIEYKYQETALNELTVLELAKEKNDYIFIDYTKMIEQVQEDMIMNEDSFVEVFNMLRSDDKESIEIGTELLTNFNLQKSRFFIDILIAFCLPQMHNTETAKKITFKPIRKYLLEDSIFAKDLYGHQLSYYTIKKKCELNYKLEKHWYDRNERIKILNKLINFYIDNNLTDSIPLNYIRGQYYNQIVNGINFFMNQFPLFKMTDIIIDFNTDLFPNLVKKYTDEQEKSLGRDELGEDLQELVDVDLSEYCDEPERIEIEGQSEGGPDQQGRTEEREITV